MQDNQLQILTCRPLAVESARLGRRNFAAFATAKIWVFDGNSGRVRRLWTIWGRWWGWAKREEMYKRTMEDENGGLSLGPISSTYRQTGSQILTLIGDLCFFYNATPPNLSLSLTTGTWTKRQYQCSSLEIIQFLDSGQISGK